MPSELDPRLSLKVIQWRCRRGTRELDHILMDFVDQHYESLDLSEQRAFSALLDWEDPLLADALNGKPLAALQNDWSGEDSGRAGNQDIATLIKRIRTTRRPA